MVYSLQGCDNLWLQVGIVLVGHGIECAENLALLGAVGGLAIAQYDDGTYNQE